MARTGAIIESPIIGERVIFCKTDPPVVAQRLMSAVLSPIAGLRGYPVFYPEGNETQTSSMPVVFNR